MYSRRLPPCGRWTKRSCACPTKARTREIHPLSKAWIILLNVLCFEMLLLVKLRCHVVALLPAVIGCRLGGRRVHPCLRSTPVSREKNGPTRWSDAADTDPWLRPALCERPVPAKALGRPPSGGAVGQVAELRAARTGRLSSTPASEHRHGGTS